MAVVFGLYAVFSVDTQDVWCSKCRGSWILRGRRGEGVRLWPQFSGSMRSFLLTCTTCGARGEGVHGLCVFSAWLLNLCVQSLRHEETRAV